MTPVSYTVKDFCTATGLGKTTVYERIRTGEIKSLVLFGRRLIPASEAFSSASIGFSMMRLNCAKTLRKSDLKLKVKVLTLKS